MSLHHHQEQCLIHGNLPLPQQFIININLCSEPIVLTVILKEHSTFKCNLAAVLCCRWEREICLEASKLIPGRSEI